MTIAGTAVSKAALEGSGTTNVTIITPEGILTITGYNLVTGVVSYSYDPSGTAKDHTGGEIVDAISIVVRDNNGDMQNGMLNINILDTVPLAHPDANAITEDAAIDTVGGNVIDIGAGKDTLGADATSVTGVVAGTGAPGNNVAAGSTSTAGATVVTGQYGSLLLGADGSYSYRLDNTNAAVNALKDTETLSETFTYTITDADGDPSTTTLTLTINGTTDGGPSIVPVDGNAGATGQASVLEAGLTGPATTETTSGTINVGSPDGLTSVKVGGVTLTVAQLQALSVGSPQVIDTGEGTLTLTGFSGTGSAPLSGEHQLHLHPEGRAEPARRERKQRPDCPRSHRPRQHHDDRHADRPDRQRHPDRQRRQQQRDRRHDQRRQHRQPATSSAAAPPTSPTASAPTPGPTRSPPSASAAPRRPSAAHSPPPTAISRSTLTAATATVWTTPMLRSTRSKTRKR